MKKQKENIYELLKTIKDPRRSEGKRHKIEVVIMIILMGIMAGAQSERAITRFIENNKNELIKALKVENNKLPSRSVIRSVIKNLDYKELSELFKNWALKTIKIKKGDLVNIDGKSIRGTVENSQNKFQNFVSLVNVYANKQKQVLASEKIETKKESEIPKVQEIIKTLNLQGIFYTLDALHCQKKLSKI